ncbi:hypothetical protein [Nocardioides baekrokdamisoli]|uniref:hypothetical protein n=1 Tax=Nocardioides baekrokdamisoli TaxID=1804624 RepID=UPI0013DDD420|nr:hypothetical protein [Nocardioides baekrokdamisoli]
MMRRAARLLGLALLAGCWVAFAVAPAYAGAPPAPVVTTPSGSTVTVLVGAQPIHFAGTVTGPIVAGTDRVFVVHNDGSLDPPQICNIVLSSTDWACDSSATFVVGTYQIDVSWFANDPSFSGTPQKTTLTVHVLPYSTPTPTPTPTPTHTHSASPSPAPTHAPPPPTHSVPAPLPVPTTSATPTPTHTPSPTPTPTVTPAAPTVTPAPPIPVGYPRWLPTDHPKTVLGIGVAVFTVLALIGPAGLALSAGASAGSAALTMTGAVVGGAAVAGSATSHRRGKGSVASASTKSAAFSGAGAGIGDQSRTWRWPGWHAIDALSLVVPRWLAPRSPLTARVLADGSYLRAIFGSAWLLGCPAGLVLGIVAGRHNDGLPIPPSVTITAVLLVLAIIDAGWGAAGLVGFVLAMLVAPSHLVGFAPQVRSFLGLAALWFAIPLIAAAARPFRRVVGDGRRYTWDRWADTVIAALFAGWAVQKVVRGLPGLSGLDLPIGRHSSELALLAMATVVVRVALEEWAAHAYPLRLAVVSIGKLPSPGAGQKYFATLVRTVLFVFLAVAFIGNCWQLWVGAALFLLPQVLGIHEKSFPNSERLHRLLPVGVLKTLVMLLIGTFFVRWVFSWLHDPSRMLRDGFVLLALPGLALSLIGLFGHDGPDQRWTWRRQLLGVLIVAVTAGLVLTGW